MGTDMFEEERAKLQHDIKVLKSTQTELQQQLERARAAEKQTTLAVRIDRIQAYRQEWSKVDMTKQDGLGINKQQQQHLNTDSTL